MWRSGRAPGAGWFAPCLAQIAYQQYYIRFFYFILLNGLAHLHAHEWSTRALRNLQMRVLRSVMLLVLIILCARMWATDEYKYISRYEITEYL